MINRRAYSDIVPVVALATGPQRSALAVLRLTGSGCIELAGRCFSRPRQMMTAAANSVLVGMIIDPTNGAPVDQVCVTLFHKPRSYTGEEALEISCHGSPAVIGKLLAVLRQAGFHDALPGEFTYRAFLNGKMDITQAEAVEELIAAGGELGRQGAVARLGGALKKAAGRCEQLLTEQLAQLEAPLNYGEDEFFDDEIDIEVIERQLRLSRRLLAQLQSGFAARHIYQEGAKVALVGHNNSGKSTLFNRLLGQQRALVADSAGTTRDYLEAATKINGVPLRLFDTAGLNQTATGLEAAGIERGRQLAADADLLLRMTDSSDAASKYDNLHTAGSSAAIIDLWSRCDLSRQKPPEGYIAISSRTGQGIDRLKKEIVAFITAQDSFNDDSLLIISPRQQRLLTNCLKHVDEALSLLASESTIDIIAENLQQGLDLLHELNGKIMTREALDSLFSQFCLGK